MFNTIDSKPYPVRETAVTDVVIRLLAVALLALCTACGNAENTATSAGGEAAQAPSSAAPSKPGGDERASFVLCDAFQPVHYEEFAAIVGFEVDESGSLLRSECIVKGSRIAFARVKLQPTLVQSAEALATQSYDGEASPAPELGDGAWYVADGLQPHVIFPMGKMILDVDAENEDTPSRETMIKLALRVREILQEANH